MQQLRTNPQALSHAFPLDPNHIEREILRAYFQHAVVPKQANGVRTTTLAQFGPLEVRLSELPQQYGGRPMVAPF